MTILQPGTRPANPTRAPSILNSSTSRAVDNARLHLRTGNPGAYARVISGEHRAANRRQQAAIEAVIAEDATAHLFARHPADGCLLAMEG